MNSFITCANCCDDALAAGGGGDEEEDEELELLEAWGSCGGVYIGQGAGKDEEKCRNRGDVSCVRRRADRARKMISVQTEKEEAMEEQKPEKK
jgi:hypothetical protein